MKIFVDDERTIGRDQNYSIVTNYRECINMIEYCRILKNPKIDVLHLDYELGEVKTGLDILKYLNDVDLRPEQIIIHSTHLDGVRLMEEYIKENFKDSIYTYSPMAK